MTTPLPRLFPCPALRYKFHRQSNEPSKQFLDQNLTSELRAVEIPVRRILTSIDIFRFVVALTTRTPVAPTTQGDLCMHGRHVVPAYEWHSK